MLRLLLEVWADVSLTDSQGRDALDHAAKSGPTGLDRLLPAEASLPGRGPEYFDQLSRELESLPQERNRLIHLDLARVNFEDEVECNALSIQLDAQNDRIIRATEFLGTMLEHMQGLARFIASNEGLLQELVSPTFVEEDAE